MTYVKQSNCKTMACLSGIIDTSERGNAATRLSFEKISYHGGFPGCCVSLVAVFLTKLHIQALQSGLATREDLAIILFFPTAY